MQSNVYLDLLIPLDNHHVLMQSNSYRFKNTMFLPLVSELYAWDTLLLTDQKEQYLH